MNRSKERKKNRLRGHDYSQNGYYFVTTCVQRMNCVFGDVIDSEMRLNELGGIVEKCLLYLHNHYKNCKILCYAVMPNHVHAIVFIDNANVETGLKPVPTKNHSLSELIRGFKTFSSKQIHELGNYDFKWQRSFHDHIIRGDAEYERISEYICNNPLNWEDDNYFKL